jgi:hypothetical protein
VSSGNNVACWLPCFHKNCLQGKVKHSLRNSDALQSFPETMNTFHTCLMVHDFLDTYWVSRSTHRLGLGTCTSCINVWYDCMSASVPYQLSMQLLEYLPAQQIVVQLYMLDQILHTRSVFAMECHRYTKSVVTM